MRTSKCVKVFICWMTFNWLKVVKSLKICITCCRYQVFTTLFHWILILTMIYRWKVISSCSFTSPCIWWSIELISILYLEAARGHRLPWPMVGQWSLQWQNSFVMFCLGCWHTGELWGSENTRQVITTNNQLTPNIKQNKT